MAMTLDTTKGFQKSKLVIFKSIRVEDVRYDTTHIGLYSILGNVLIPSVKNYKINLKGGLRNSLSAYLNSFFKQEPGKKDMELICFIKNLSITRRDTLVENESLHKKFGQLNFEAEVFLRSDTNYYAAIKIDTILYSVIGLKKKQISDDMRDHLLMPALQLLQNKISQTDWENITTRNAFSESTVNDHYLTARFNIPVLTQPCKRGVYRSYIEFRNNTPSINNFKIEKGRFKTIVLLDKQGNDLPVINMFGYCDGERYWILMGNYGFPLFRMGNGFEFFMTLGKGLKIIRALDMEKGKVY